MTKTPSMGFVQRSADPMDQKMGWLAYWLSKPAWTVREAALLITGILPQRFGYWTSWLPGREPWGRDEEERAGLRDAWESEVKREIERLQLHFSSIPNMAILRPKDFLKLLAEKSVFRPPWLTAAQRDAECSKLLPVMMQPIAPNYWRSLGHKAQTAQLLSRHPDYEEQVLHAFTLWENGKSTGVIRKSMQETYAERSLDSTLANWIKEFRATKSPDKQLADIRHLKSETASR